MRQFDWGRNRHAITSALASASSDASTWETRASIRCTTPARSCGLPTAGGGSGSRFVRLGSGLAATGLASLALVGAWRGLGGGGGARFARLGGRHRPAPQAAALSMSRLRRDRGAELEAKDQNGGTALHVAAVNGQVEALGFLY